MYTRKDGTKDTVFIHTVYGRINGQGPLARAVVNFRNGGRDDDDDESGGEVHNPRSDLPGREVARREVARNLEELFEDDADAEAEAEQVGPSRFMKDRY